MTENESTAIFKRECEEVMRLGCQIGFGNMMDIASALWAKELLDSCGDSKFSNGAFYPTILSNMKEGELTDKAVQRRKDLIKLFNDWGW